MKKLMTGLAASGLLTLALGVVGCSDKSTTTDKKEVSGPGGTTTITDKKEVKQSGDNPPPAGTTNPAPPKQ